MKAAYLEPQGVLWWPGYRCRAAVGRGGIVPAAIKREGDGATPAAELPLRRLLFRADRISRPPPCNLPCEPLGPSDGWCDDPSSTDYNCQVTLPFAAHHEVLWRADDAYDLIVVLGWNDAPVRRGRGSAIFLHLARGDYEPTDGCVGLARDDLIRCLAAGITHLVTREK